MVSRVAMVTVVVLGTAGSAHALKPGTHADITAASCLAANLPRDFCTRIATEDYDTDSREWNDLRAHAQIDTDETACTAADRGADRVWQLGGELRTQLAAVHASPSDANIGATASALGRALHTIQDNCAHHGMPNPQHAWFSMSDFCDGTELSPDVQDDAASCARVETDRVMALVAAEIQATATAHALDARSCPPTSSSPHSQPTTPICQRRFLPGPIDACGFLGTAKDWDGTDRTWENAIVTPALHDAFAAGLAGAVALAPICGGVETVLSRAVSAPLLDVSAGPPHCPRASLFCLGKADDSDNPFGDATPATVDTGGCSTGSGTGGAGLGLALGVAALRRRRH